MKNGKWKMENRPLGALLLRIVLGCASLGDVWRGLGSVEWRARRGIL